MPHEHSHLIRGHMRADDGTIGPRFALHVQTVRGRWHAVPGPEPIRAEAYAICDDLRGVQIVSDATEAERRDGIGFAWEFLPDPGECERVGMPVRGG